MLTCTRAIWLYSDVLITQQATVRYVAQMLQNVYGTHSTLVETLKDPHRTFLGTQFMCPQHRDRQDQAEPPIGKHARSNWPALVCSQRLETLL